MTLLQKIQFLSDTMTDSKKIIADFILDHKAELPYLTLNDIQDRAYISKSSLVRFAKVLGFSGWKDFLIDLVQEIHLEDKHFAQIDPDLPFEAEDSKLTIAQKIASLQIASIEDSLNLIDEDGLTRAAYFLKKARRVVIFGISPNNILAELFRRRMAALGRVIEVPHHDEMGLIAHSLTSDDLAILISYSGLISQFPKKLLNYLADNKVISLALTSREQAPLAQNCDLVLPISSREQLVSKISSFASEESILFLLNTLYASYFALDYEKNYAYKQKTASALEAKRLDENEES